MNHPTDEFLKDCQEPLDNAEALLQEAQTIAGQMAASLKPADLPPQTPRHPLSKLLGDYADGLEAIDTSKVKEMAIVNAERIALVRLWAARAAELEKVLADQEACQMILWDVRESPAWVLVPDMLHVPEARRLLPDGILYRLVEVKEAEEGQEESNEERVVREIREDSDVDHW